MGEDDVSIEVVTVPLSAELVELQALAERERERYLDAIEAEHGPEARRLEADYLDADSALVARLWINGASDPTIGDAIRLVVERRTAAEGARR